MRALIATDGSADAQAAADLLHHLGAPDPTDVTLLYVVEELKGLIHHPREVGHLKATLQNEARALLREEAARLERYGWSIVAETRNGHAAHKIVDAVTETDADLVVVGSHGHGRLEAFLLGTVTQRVCTHAPTSVLVSRRQKSGAEPAIAKGERPVRILVAVDGSAAADRAVEFIARLGVDREVSTEVVSVITPQEVMAGDEDLVRLWGQERDAAERALATAAEQLGERFAKVSTAVREGDPSMEILAAAKDCNATVIALGGTGHSSIERFILGTVASRVIQHASSSVLLVRPGQEG